MVTIQDLIGRTLGRYRIVEQIGAGGMGVVYRAHDERLDRDVAIKVLPEEVAGTGERLTRFEREAKILASLSHQNIAHLYGLETVERTVGEGLTPSRETVSSGAGSGTGSGSTPRPQDLETSPLLTFLVMELAEGETLADRIERAPVPIDDALDWARQIAEGLEAAHEKGIVHRDLKPANVMLSPEGQIKILDFGLAKAWHPESSDVDLNESPTLTAGMTRTGTLLGTAAYMSPEQARGKAVDRRTDVWAFGCVLYELLTRQRVFQGGDASQITAAILRDDPDWASLPPETPSHIRRLLQRCLVKKPRDRMHDIADVRIVVESEPSEQLPDEDQHVRGDPRSRIRWIAIAATAVIAAAVGLAVWAPWSTAPPPATLDETTWVAVAPLENRTGDASLGTLGQRAVDVIVRGFSKVGRSADVFTMDEVPYPPGKGPALNPKPRDRSSQRSVGEKGPHIFVSGAYYLDGNELEIQARLTDYDSGERLFSVEPIRAERSDVATALDQLRERIVTAAASHWQETLDLRLMNPPSSYEALAAYVRAQETWSGSEETAAAFNRVLDLDPEFHIARFFLIKAYGNLGEREKAEQQLAEAERRTEDFTYFERLRFNECSLKELTRVEQLSLSRELVRVAPHIKWGGGRWNLANALIDLSRPREAIEVLEPLLPTFLPDTHPIAWWALNNVSNAHHVLGEYEKELKWADIGLERFPDVGEFYLHKAAALSALDRVEAAKTTTDACLAMRLRETAFDAGSVLILIAMEFRAHGHPQESRRIALRASEWFDQRSGGLDATEREPGDLWVHSYALLFADRTDQAMEYLKELEERSWRGNAVSGTLGVIAAQTGDLIGAQRVFDTLIEINGDKPSRFASYWAACVAAHLGEKNRAVELMRQSLAEGLPYSWIDPCSIEVEPLRDYPPFQELIAPKG